MVTGQKSDVSCQRGSYPSFQEEEHEFEASVCWKKNTTYEISEKNLLNKHNTIDNKTYYLPTPII